MNKLLLTFALLFTVFSNAQTEEAITTTGTVTEVATKPTFYVSGPLKPYVNTFFASILADGWNISNIKKNNVFVVFDYEIEENLEDKAGVALGMNDDKLVYVVISVEAWINLQDYAKQDLVNHELMHDIFNVKHTNEDDEEKLMHPSSYPKSWADTFYRLIDAIVDLNNAL